MECNENTVPQWASMYDLGVIKPELKSKTISQKYRTEYDKIYLSELFILAIHSIPFHIVCARQ